MDGHLAFSGQAHDTGGSFFGNYSPWDDLADVAPAPGSAPLDVPQEPPREDGDIAVTEMMQRQLLSKRERAKVSSMSMTLGPAVAAVSRQPQVPQFSRPPPGLSLPPGACLSASPSASSLAAGSQSGPTTVFPPQVAPQTQQPSPQSSVVWAQRPDTGQLQLCLRLQPGDGSEELLQQANNIAMNLIGCSTQAGIETEDQGEAIVTMMSRLGWECIAMRAQAAAGPEFAGISGVATGSNVKIRGRAARLSLVLAIACEFPHKFGQDWLAERHPLLAKLAAEALRSRRLGGEPTPPTHSMPLAEATGRFPPPPPPPEVSPEAEETQPLPAKWLGMPPRASSAPTAPPAVPPAPPGPAPQPLANVSSNIPLECLEDPFVEMRPFPGGDELWPYCTLCSNWSDPTHLVSRKHQKRLANHASAGLPMPGAQGAGYGAQGADYGTSAQQSAFQPSRSPQRQPPPRPSRMQVFQWSLSRVRFSWASVEGLDEDDAELPKMGSSASPAEAVGQTDNMFEV